ncbi:MAG: hypothetical protein NVS3B26_19090 [Mycobacteriales bacterium]
MRKATTAALGLLLTTNIALVTALTTQGTAQGSGSAPVTETNVDQSGFIRTHEQGTALNHVTNFPLDGSGNLKVSGSTTVSGTVNAVQSGNWTVLLDPTHNAVAASQSGPWSVGLDPNQNGVSLDPTSEGHLAAIDTAVAKPQYDSSGNLKVNLASGGNADPTSATAQPFGLCDSCVNAAGHFTVTSATPVHVTAYSFHGDGCDFTVQFQGGPIFEVQVKSGQPAVLSFDHALIANALNFTGLNSSCHFGYSVVGYS